MSDLQIGNTMIDGIFVEHARPIAAQRQDPILFVHGGCHGSWCWENYLPYFARAGWACYALNWYNHYNSECLPKERFLNRSIADVTQEIGIVARQLGRPPILVGHSMGGLAVLKYAEIAPVKALVLLTPGLPAETGGPGLELALDPAEPFGPPPRDWAKAQFLATSSEAIFDRYYPLLCPESPRAVIEATIRDLKYGLALKHFPSGSMTANAAWLQLNVLAHNLCRWTNQLIPPRHLTTKTLRHRYLTLPGRITTASRTTILHLPTHWPWAQRFQGILTRLRAIPQLA